MKEIGIYKVYGDGTKVTIPAEIRRALGIGKGDRVRFFLEGDRAYFVKVEG